MATALPTDHLSIADAPAAMRSGVAWNMLMRGSRGRDIEMARRSRIAFPCGPVAVEPIGCSSARTFGIVRLADRLHLLLSIQPDFAGSYPSYFPRKLDCSTGLDNGRVRMKDRHSRSQRRALRWAPDIDVDRALYRTEDVTRGESVGGLLRGRHGPGARALIDAADPWDYCYRSLVDGPM